ncbi:VWA domain-containing protein [Saccharothrix longispora]|uniref:Ca-activated chloride channel family protein n=1 Tax=Saccharothrix longispora TaxID=33920 RepID=A0ABU1PWI5_9PSEU|nr:VWA domain-containing protein [Saccharothrix longispora]MBY8849860.1 VWA domain-containing protein [Saccharothrix sp. MB29]MDR6595002.1 Ca-activated chloride channel family protein [Saccharothrix longispora]MDU0290528.1 VWA domain-containing protein [Saccharothrix longispora]
MSLTGFAAPWWFLLLIAVAAVAALYVVLQRVLRKRTLRFANLPMLEKVAPKRQGWYKHVPPALLLVAFILLTVALAGPTAEQKVPRNRATVMLVIDTSLSMKATDVKPSRLEAAQVAAKSFADGLTPGINLGLISFAGSATVLVAPTTDRSAVTAGIDGLKLAQSTATGDAIVAALAAIDSFGKVVGGADGPPPARVVLMTDGKETVGTRKAFDAAEDAKKVGIPISTISFGTEEGVVEIEGRRQDVPVDDDSMKEIAKLSGGEFFKAASAEELRRVYDTLGEQIGYEKKQTDASRPWVALGTVLGLLAVAGALVFGQRLP